MPINLAEKQQQAKTTAQCSTANKSIVGLLVIIFLLALSGCGNKGDLYMPEQDDAQKQESIE